MRARSAFKLQELHARYGIIPRGSLVLELGAAPGGWSVVASELSGVSKQCSDLSPIDLESLARTVLPQSPNPNPLQIGKPRASIFDLTGVSLQPSTPSIPLAIGSQPCCSVVAVDFLAIEPIPGVQVVKGDALNTMLLPLLALISPSRVPMVLLSDMAPSFTGETATDQLRQMKLAWGALRVAASGGLGAGGTFVVKVRYGDGYNEVRAACRRMFERVHEAKPPASRAGSAEAYLVGKGFRGGGFSAPEIGTLSQFGLST